MKTARHLLIAALCTAAACSPKNEEVTEQQVKIGPPAEALDSVADTRKDALQTDENEISPTLPLPQPVLQLLAQKYPGFKQPVLSDAVKSKSADLQQGPIIVRADLTSDNQLDYALQLQQNNDLIIVALTDQGNNNWTLHELHRDILFNDRGNLKSLYYLYVTPQGEEVYSEEENQGKELKADAVTVALENSATTYVYENGGFRAYRNSGR